VPRPHSVITAHGSEIALPESRSPKLEDLPGLRAPNELIEGAFHGAGVSFLTAQARGLREEILTKHKICTFHTLCMSHSAIAYNLQPILHLDVAMPSVRHHDAG